jgi:hypothetical protein
MFLEIMDVRRAIDKAPRSVDTPKRNIEAKQLG